MILWFVLALASLAGAEALLRAYQWLQRDARLTESSDLLHHRLRPNLDARDRQSDPPYRLITNAQGFVEEREIARAKPAGTFRIFQIGDSNVQGFVDPPLKMARLVEAGLAARRPPGVARFEVINAGVASYSTYPYYVLIARVLLDYAPDLIVLNYDMTDVSDDLAYRRFAAFGADGRPRALVDVEETSRFAYALTPTGIVPVERSSRFYRAVVENTAVGFYADKVWTRWRVNRSLRGFSYKVDADANWLAKEWTPAIEANVAHSMELLGAIAELCARNGVRLALTSVPHRPQFEGEWSARPHAELARAAEKAGIPFLNGFAEIERRVPSERRASLYFPTDPIHFNEAGHRVWADMQLDFLTDPRFGLISR